MSVPTAEVSQDTGIERVSGQQFETLPRIVTNGLSDIDVLRCKPEDITLDALTRRVVSVVNLENDPLRRIDLNEKNCETVAQIIGKQLADEFQGYLLAESSSFRAYFILCENMHESEVQNSIHELSHKAFLSELGLSFEELKSVEENGSARLEFGRDEDIGHGEDTILEAKFQTLPDAVEPFAIYYAANRDAFHLNDQHSFITPKTRA